jgi:ABC-type branched-subunit amino acid transport system ATPase component
VSSSNYLKGRRLRLFGGPNGSGKSTIFNEVDENYDIGYYINADEIEKELKQKGHLDLARYSLRIDDTFALVGVVTYKTPLLRQLNRPFVKE